MSPPPLDPLWFRLACFLSRHLPRGKSAVPRLIARAVAGEAAFLTDTHRGFAIAGNRHCVDALAFLRVHEGWDEYVLDTCLRFLGPGDCFFDVGANAGYMSLGCLHHFADAVSVVAFEPQAPLVHAIELSRSVNGFRNLQTVNACLSDRNGHVRLYLASHAIHASLEPRDRATRSITVPARRLDDLVGNGMVPAPSVIKLDVEGAEMKVLTGGARTLSACRPTIVFECDENSARYGYSLGDVMSLLRSFGYDAFLRIAPSGELRKLVSSGDAGERDFVATTARTLAERAIACT